MKNLNYELDRGKGTLRIRLSALEHGQAISIIKRAKKSRSSYNICRLYYFLVWMNTLGLPHVRKEDLAEMIFSKHKERLNKSLDILRDIGWITFECRENPSTKRWFYIYHTLPIETHEDEEYGIRNETIITMDYAIPEITWTLVLKTIDKKTPIPSEHKQDFGLKEPFEGIDSNNAESDICNSFRESFISWYNELIIIGQINTPGHFSNNDGRFYHKFHGLTKEYRKDLVYWEGEHVEEVWDASSAVFTVICYYLKFVKEYSNEIEEATFFKEIDNLLQLTLKGRLYESVMQFSNSQTSRKIDRSQAKELCNIYRSKTRRTLFRKDGNLKNVWWAQRLRWIDEFFKNNFPNIRDFMLDYPTMYIQDKRNKMEFVYNKEMDRIEMRQKMHKTSALQHDIMPYEFELISMGICKDLYNDFGVKSITVHDAIYMKASDARKHIDIDNLFRKQLGIIEKVSQPLF